MKSKTSELTGFALDWAVAKCEGMEADGRRFMEVFLHQHSRGDGYCYSTNWAQGGPIIERGGIEICRLENGEWRAQLDERGCLSYCRQYGSTPLIAAMRCYVACKLGDDIELPEGLQTNASA